MDILKTATEWAKAEVFSSLFFILFGLMFVLATVGFWQLGKTEVAKSFIFPTLVAGILILTVGIGIFYANKTRVNTFKTDFQADASTFVKSEITRTEKSMTEYKNVVFKIIPIIIAIAALLIIFVDKPIWRAISTTTIAMMVVIIFIDSNANARLKDYHKELVSVDWEAIDE